MTITHRTRKMLWGRSGNRCALCKNELVVDAQASDGESVVGEECHIISLRPTGPRYDPSYPQEKLDSHENLILLCRLHHKVVDDQYRSYSVEKLRRTKSEHEAEISQKLKGTPKQKPHRIRRLKQNIPRHLSRLTTGNEVLKIVMSACAFAMDHDEPQSQEVAELVGNFLHTAKDWGELGDDLEPMDRTKAAFDITRALKELEVAGFWVFGAREVQVMEGGLDAAPSDWPVAVLVVLHKDNDSIASMWV